MSTASCRERLFAVDLRSLAAFRVGLAVAILVDLVTRAGAIAQHYTDGGVLPRDAYARLVMGSPWQWSFHFLTGSLAGQWALFALAAAAATALLLGYRTRMAACLSWAMVVSLQARNPLVLYGADQLLRLLLFWGMLLPLGSAWSLDARRSGKAAAGVMSLCSTATAALLLQPCVMYFFSGLLKRNDSWETGHALAHALTADMYVTATGRWLAGFPAVVDTLGQAVPWMEMLAPLLLFVPWRTRGFRIAGLALLVAFHAALASCLVTGLFPLVAIVGLVPFLPAQLWDRAGLRAVASGALSAAPAPATPLRRAAAVTAQVLVASLFAYTIAWNVAGLRIEEYSDGQATAWAREWWSRGGKGLPLTFRDLAVERRMGNFGWIGRVAALHQRWDMFIRVGPEIRGWPVVLGTLEDGRTVQVLEDGAPVDATGRSRPESWSNFYPGTRWLVYFTSLRMSGMRPEREILAAVVAGDWRERHPQLPLAKLQVLFVQDGAAIDGAGGPRPEVWYEGPVSIDPDASAAPDRSDRG